MLYQKYYTGGVDEDGDKRRDTIRAATLYGIVGGAVFVWLLSFSAFIKLINKEYLRTFFCTMTGSQYTVHLFRTGTSDYMKMNALTVNEHHLTSIRDEVKVFVHANWDGWNKEKPEWFTEALVSSIPDDFIPRVAKDRMRSSMFWLALGVADGNNATGSNGDKGKDSSKVAPAAAADSGRASGAETQRTVREVKDRNELLG
jgi:hypothetical protein